MSAHPDPAVENHPSMPPDVAHAARTGDMPAGDTYQPSGGYDLSPGNVGMYWGVGLAILALVLVASIAWALLA